MSRIEARNLWKRYGNDIILERVNLVIEPGEFCTVVGPSGCGKSTFLRMLLSQEKPSTGELLIDGEPISPEPQRDRGIVFQRYSVYPHLTVEQNVIMGAEFEQSKFLGKLFGNARREALDRAGAMLESVGLHAARQLYPSSLSGGMQQRLAIAQALICRPRVLLLDEPFGALDPGTRAKMHELTSRLWSENGMTVFMVTHDLQEGFRLGTRLLVLDKIREEPEHPGAYGATVTYDIDLSRRKKPKSETDLRAAAEEIARGEEAMGAV